MGFLNSHTKSRFIIYRRHKNATRYTIRCNNYIFHDSYIVLARQYAYSHINRHYTGAWMVARWTNNIRPADTVY